jgi:hypothetical protein
MQTIPIHPITKPQEEKSLILIEFEGINSAMISLEEEDMSKERGDILVAGRINILLGNEALYNIKDIFLTRSSHRWQWTCVEHLEAFPGRKHYCYQNHIKTFLKSKAINERNRLKRLDFTNYWLAQDNDPLANCIWTDETRI